MQATLSIIGAGKVGKTLSKLWSDRSVFRIQDVLNRSLDSARSAAAFVGAGTPVAAYAELCHADVFLLAVSDDQIAACCAALAEQGLLGEQSIVFHCSGALPSSVLTAASECGAAIASIHPIRSFASPENVVRNFAGTWCGMEGDSHAIKILAAAFEAIDARMVQINAEAKIHYHAGAVFACNYLVTLLDIAKQSYVRAGIAPDVALELMGPLVRETMENIFRLGPEAALTGPIARGDMATATKQWQAVQSANTEHGALYKQLMDLTVELATRRGKRTTDA
jgi:predicted short-subunit dehydrogenase-like oxidoreductase (DUF2520 family)